MTTDTISDIIGRYAVTQRRKRIEKILQRPTRMSFKEVEQILEDFGMTCVRSKGSRHVFKGANRGPIIVPKSGGKWVAERYLDEVCIVLDLDSLDLDLLD